MREANEGRTLPGSIRAAHLPRESHVEIRFDTYYDNEALAERLAYLAETHPSLVELRTLGTSHEGREIPLVVLTNRDTGPDTEKPGFWCDANIHATEVTGTMAALYCVVDLLGKYGDDPRVTRMLDRQVFYVAPRLNPDGAALCLSKNPEYLRSGTRAYPHADREDGLHAADVDGDGRQLQMRFPDPAGDWRESDADPRFLIKRRPGEEGGTYYRLLPEGRIENYDGHLIRIARPHRSLDFNRNFPAGWRPDGEQYGAGEYPGSEPEIRAVLDFLGSHPNVFGAITFHTFSRVILRPFSSKPDDEMETLDLWLFESIGELGTEHTGYPCVSVNHHFRYHPKQTIGGAFDDWAYEHLGLFAFTVELWDLPHAAGVTEKHEKKTFIEWWRKHPVEDDLKILEFLKDKAPEALVDWYEVEHPELGKIELGGLDFMRAWRNPPPALLEDEIKGQAGFVTDFASLAPYLEWVDVTATRFDDDVVRVVAVVENQGFLSTSGTVRARKAGRARPVRLELSLPEGASLLRGAPRQEVGHLEGRSNKPEVIFTFSPTDNRGKAEWLVKVRAGAELTVTAHGDRAGTIRKTVTASG